MWQREKGTLTLARTINALKDQILREMFFFYFGLRYKVQKRLESQRPKGAGTIIGGLISGKGGSEVALAWSTTG